MTKNEQKLLDYIQDPRMKFELNNILEENADMRKRLLDSYKLLDKAYKMVIRTNFKEQLEDLKKWLEANEGIREDKLKKLAT